MIIRETATGFTCITQHDHAQLSGWLAAVWGNPDIPCPAAGGPLVLASALHDVGWIPIDQRPRWNERTSQPYSFRDEPLARKLPQYTAGVDLVARHDPYAALLCSMHYTSFMPSGGNNLSPETAAYLQNEHARQTQLRKTLTQTGRKADVARAEHDLSLLKLWDHISLYVALNEPGASKTREHPWYRDGFPPTALQPGGDPVRFMARWLDKSRIALQPFPLRAKLPYALPYRQVPKAEIEQHGLERAFQNSPIQIQVIWFGDWETGTTN